MNDDINKKVERIIEEAERRKYPRVKVNIPVNLLMDKSAEYKAQTKDISENGVCLITNKPLAVNTFLVIRFTLAGSDEMNIYCKVLWNREVQPNIFENGLNFWHIEKHDLSFLQKYVKENLTKTST